MGMYGGGPLMLPHGGRWASSAPLKQRTTTPKKIVVRNLATISKDNGVPLLEGNIWANI